MAMPGKRGWDADDGPDQKKARRSPAPSMGSSLGANSAKSSENSSNFQTAMSASLNDTNNLFVLDSDESDDDDPDIIDLTKDDIDLPPPKRIAQTVVKSEDRKTLEHLAPPAISGNWRPNGSSPVKAESYTNFDDFPRYPVPGSYPTPLHTATPTGSPAKSVSSQTPNSRIVPKMESATYPGAMKAEHSPSPRKFPKIESPTYRRVTPKTEAGIIKHEHKFGNQVFAGLDHASQQMPGFNPILGEVPPFPMAPPPDATDEQLNAFWQQQTQATANVSENENVVADIVRNLSADEERLSKMPKAKQPVELGTKLLDHQLQAIQWMKEKERPKLPGPADPDPVQFWKRHESGAYINVATNAVEMAKPPELCSGGILADDMGLGKTIEMIGLILTSPGPGPTLIVAPKGVMSTWEKQLAQHVHWNYYPKIVRFYQKSATNSVDELKSNKIVITTYHKMVIEAKLLTAIKWRRVILDEGHNIRNPHTKMAQVACRLNARSRWVCTGTPIINNIGDLHSLSKFLRISGGLSHGGVFKKIVGKRPAVLQAFMVQFCLRRTKAMQFVNLKLPDRDEDVERLQFSEHEREKYQVLLEDARAAARLFFENDRDQSLWNNVLERLLRLRQLCCHWTLCRKKALELFRRQIEKRNEACSATEREMRQTLVALIDANEVCGICDDPLDLGNAPVLITCRHGFCKDCLDSKLEDQAEVRCPTCNKEFRHDKIVELDVDDLEGDDDEENGDDGDGGDGDHVPANHRLSAKTDGIMEMINRTLRRDKKSKIVIFSQWTSFLDIVETQLVEKGIGFTRIDGTMGTEQRDTALKTLDTSRTTRVMLASLRVAGVGISLVAADTVVLADTWWAPAIEDQAIDRVYRLGQKRNVTIRRLVIQDSIEEKVLCIQDKKRELVGTAFQEDFKTLMTKEDRERILKKLLW